MTNSTNKVQQGIALIDTLTDEELNSLVDYIRVAYKTRQARRNAVAKAAIQVGDRVKFGTNLKPQYLQGCQGEVMEIRSSRILVRLDRPVGKYITGEVLATPASLIQI